MLNVLLLDSKRWWRFKMRSSFILTRSSYRYKLAIQLRLLFQFTDMKKKKSRCASSFYFNQLIWVSYSFYSNRLYHENLECLQYIMKIRCPYSNHRNSNRIEFIVPWLKQPLLLRHKRYLLFRKILQISSTNLTKLYESFYSSMKLVFSV